MRFTYSGFHSDRSDDGAGPESDRAEHHRIREPAARGAAVSRTGAASTRATTAATRTITTSCSRCAATSRAWGLSHTTTYKWAHSIDNIEDRGGGQGDFQSEINGRTDNRFDPDYLRGPTTNIPTHRFVSSAIWNAAVRPRPQRSARQHAGRRSMRSPVAGRCRRWCSCSPAPHLTGVLQQPLRLRHQLLRQREGGRACPDRIRTTVRRRWRSGSTPSAFSIAAFRDAQGRSIFAGRFGNAEKGNIVGPGVWNVDFAAFKDVALGARATARVNVFVTNLFNHPNWGRPETNLTSANYGRITSLSPIFPLRTIVLGGRITY